jgi:hypothetical protein
MYTGKIEERRSQSAAVPRVSSHRLVSSRAALSETPSVNNNYTYVLCSCSAGRTRTVTACTRTDIAVP